MELETKNTTVKIEKTKHTKHTKNNLFNNYSICYVGMYLLYDHSM